MPAATAHADVLQFWFEEAGPSRWWAKDPQFDALVADRFGALHGRAARCELWSWRAGADGRLAEIIVLDQFSRNIFRDRPAAFASDPLALALAQEAVAAAADRELSPPQRSFLYMPFMHSESLGIHQAAAGLFDRSGDDQLIEFEARHRVIIERFGRYPHRNTVLGRESTQSEREFLRQPDSGF